MSTRSIFPTLIYEVDFPNFEEIKEDVFNVVLPHFNDPFENKKRVDHFSDGTTIKTLSTKFDVHKNPKLNFLVEFIETHCKIYWKDSGYTNTIDPYITVMWALLTSKGGFTAPHNHNPWPIGGAFYVNADNGTGDLFLENPLEMLLGKQPVDIDGPTIYTERIKVKSGKLVLFPGWMRHHSQTNTTDGQRMVLGFTAGSILESKPKL
jgi:uncharacterized protein (TIGR02466 family)